MRNDNRRYAALPSGNSASPRAWRRFMPPLFVMAGIQLPFFPVWLKAKGLDPQMIGAGAGGRRCSCACSPFRPSRALADRRDALRAAIVVAQLRWASPATCWSASPTAPAAILIAYALASLRLHAGDAAVRNLRAQGLGARGRAYGPVRLWGSAAFILGTFAAGFAADTHAGAPSDLADRGGERARARWPRWRWRRCRLPRRRRASRQRRARICCAIRPSSRCWRRRA